MASKNGNCGKQEVGTIGDQRIPVYRGCDRALVKTTDLELVHGSDGLGDVAREYPHDKINIGEGHAINVLVTLVKEHSQEGVHLVALGPMTNVAMAHRYDPEFTKNLKSIHFMGGNIYGVGNTTSSAEFNFACDPEAANIVLTESKCPMTMAPWETTIKHYIPLEFFDQLVNTGTPIAKFLKKIAAVLAISIDKDRLVACDFMAMAPLTHPECVKTVEKYPLSVETAGRLTTGQTVVERIGSDKNQRNHVTIVTEFHDSILNELRMKMVLQ